MPVPAGSLQPSPSGAGYRPSRVRAREGGVAIVTLPDRAVPWPEGSRARMSGAVFLGIDHLVVAVADPDRAAGEIEATLGLRVAEGGRHATQGTFNRLVWLGDTFIELIGVFDRALAERSWIGRPTLAAIDAGGAAAWSLATWAIASDSLDADVARLRGQGADLSLPLAGERLRPDGRVVRWRLAAPGSLGPLEPPFLIEHAPDSAEWTAAERTARAADVHPIGGRVRLERLELGVPLADLSRVTRQYLRATGLRFRPSLAGRGARDATVGPHLVRLAPAGHGPAMPPSGAALAIGVRTAPVLVTIGLTVDGAEGRAADLHGVRFELRGTGPSRGD